MYSVSAVTDTSYCGNISLASLLIVDGSPGVASAYTEVEAQLVLFEVTSTLVYISVDEIRKDVKFFCLFRVSTFLKSGFLVAFHRLLTAVTC